MQEKRPAAAGLNFYSCVTPPEEVWSPDSYSEAQLEALCSGLLFPVSVKSDSMLEQWCPEWLFLESWCPELQCPELSPQASSFPELSFLAWFHLECLDWLASFQGSVLLELFPGLVRSGSFLEWYPEQALPCLEWD